MSSQQAWFPDWGACRFSLMQQFGHARQKRAFIRLSFATVHSALRATADISYTAEKRRSR
jgi:hypothetical protein